MAAPSNTAPKTIINTIIYCGLLWLAATGHNWAMVVVSCLTWFMLACCVLVLTSETAKNEIREAWSINPPLPLWLNSTFDGAVLFVMFYNSWFITGITYAVSIAIAIYIRFSLTEVVEN